MTKQIGMGLLALTTTASLAMAHGDGDPEKNGEKKSFLQGTTVSAKPGSGITFDAGEGFKLNLGNQFQYKWSYTSFENAANVNTFDIRRMRTWLSGHVFDETIEFMVKNDWEDANGRSTKDIWLHWTFVNDGDNSVALRAGQTKTHYGRVATGSSKRLEFVERDRVARVFSDARSRGAALHGQHLADDKIHWAAGVYNGTTVAGAGALTELGEEAANPDNEMSFVFSARFDPMGDMNGGKGSEAYSQGDLERSEELKASVGAGLAIDNGRAGGVDIEGTNINVNGALKYQGFHALAEVFLGTWEPDGGTEEDSTGWNVQGSYTFESGANSDTQYAVAGRVSGITLDDAANILTGSPLGGATGDVLEVTGGLNAYYHEHNMKSQVNYTFQSIEPDAGGDADNHIFEVMFTLIF